MLFNLTIILCCQLAGELVAAASGVPIPGPVIGMAILFAGLLYRGLPSGLAQVGDTLLVNLSLLFVPAGVGIIAHAALIGRDVVAISAALVGSTLLTIAVTAGCMILVMRRSRSDADDR